MQDGIYHEPEATTRIERADVLQCLEAAAYYDQHHDLLPKERLAFAAIPPHASILDVGCGTGRTTACLRRQGHQVIGVDISYAMIQSAHQACGDTAVLVNDACYLSFKPHEFDVVVFSFNGMDYIYPYADRLQALQEIKRVLKPGGLFIFSSQQPRRPVPVSRPLLGGGTARQAGTCDQ